MVIINGAVRLISLQFSFSNEKIVPVSVKRLGQETIKERYDRKNYLTGVSFIEPVENCSIVEFLNKIGVEGYEMVDAVYKPRINTKDLRGNDVYHMVRFLFARREFVEISDDFKKAQQAIYTELRCLCEMAMWRVRGFFNPFYKDGKEISDQFMLSVNFEARKPLFYPDGCPIVVWQKNEKGERVGDRPLPLKPEHILVVDNQVVHIIKNDY